MIVGDEYTRVLPNLALLLLGLFPFVFTQIGFVYSVVHQKPREYLQALSVAFAVFIILSVMLIPQYSAIGCSIAATVSRLVMALVLVASFRDEMVTCIKGTLAVVALAAFLRIQRWQSVG